MNAMSALGELAKRLVRRRNQSRIPVLFLHIQKTAGSSLLDVARRHYGNSVTSHGECWGQPPAKFASVEFVSGHFGYDYAKHLMADRYSFTFLRNPVERVLSMYYFCRQRNPAEFEIYNRANELDLPDFLKAARTDPWVRKNIWNNQVWQLAHGYAHLDGRTIDDFDDSEMLALAKAHLMKFNHVGFTETIDRDARVIWEDLGIPCESTTPRINGTEDRPVASEVGHDVRALIDELTCLDQSLYEYALQIYGHTGKSRE